eukprot:IDg13843t1
MKDYFEKQAGGAGRRQQNKKRVMAVYEPLVQLFESCISVNPRQQTDGAVPRLSYPSISLSIWRSKWMQPLAIAGSATDPAPYTPRAAVLRCRNCRRPAAMSPPPPAATPMEPPPSQSVVPPL